MMNTRKLLLPLLLGAALASGCSEMPTKDTTKYGDASGTTATQAHRSGTITAIEDVQADANYKLGVGTAVGAVAGGILGSAVGDSKAATAVGAVLGGLAGTYGETKVRDKTVQRVTVKMSTGGQLTILQPVDTRLHNGMAVHVEGSGENARVVP